MVATSSFSQTLATGLVLTLRPSLATAESLRKALRSHPEITVGDISAFRLPATIVSQTPRETRAWLESLPEIASVEIVFVEVAPDISPTPVAV